jgi:hypothetical protein
MRRLSLRKIQKVGSFIAPVLAAVLMAFMPVRAQGQAPSGMVPVTITVSAVGRNGAAPPDVPKEDVSVRVEGKRAPVLSWVPAQGAHAAMDLMIVIDDSVGHNFGSQLRDLRDFMHAQPASTRIAIGYSTYGTVQVAQDFTSDKDLASKALRLPLHSGSATVIWLSVEDYLSHWRPSETRSEMLLITTGEGRSPQSGVLDTDMQNAYAAAQRAGVILHAVYYGSGRATGGEAGANEGQSELTEATQQTGGELYTQGLLNPVSIGPALHQLSTVLANQYVLTFAAKPQGKAKLVPIKVSTELSGVKLHAAKAVFVPAR